MNARNKTVLGGNVSATKPAFAHRVRRATRPSWAIAQRIKRIGMGYTGDAGLLRAMKRGHQ